MRKGEHGELVVYADRITRTETDEKGEETEREIPFLKGYTVFNAEQCDGLPAHFTAPAAPALDPVQRIEHADSFFAATGADIRHGGNRAYYADRPDYVQMPPFETFRDAESYAATLAHECTHWTKHEKIGTIGNEGECVGFRAVAGRIAVIDRKTAELSMRVQAEIRATKRTIGREPPQDRLGGGAGRHVNGRLGADVYADSRKACDNRQCNDTVHRARLFRCSESGLPVRWVIADTPSSQQRG